MNRILVIGATGNVGREVVSQLPPDTRVRALSRSPSAAAFPPRVEVVRGDLTLPETLDACLEDIDAVFLVWTARPSAVGPALERIVNRARRIVFLSSPHKTPHPLFQGAQPNPLTVLHGEIEGLIEASGREWTFLRPGMFAANALSWWAPRIRAGGGVVRWPYAGVPTAPIDERDIAAVAVRALCEEGHSGAEYVLTGPESLTQSEQVSAIGDAIGRPLRMLEISPDEARHEMLPLMTPFIVNMLLASWAAADGQPALVTSTVAQVTGAAPRSFAEWAAHRAAAFRA